MARTLQKLTDVKARSERLKGGRHSDGGGLYLNVTASGNGPRLFMWVSGVWSAARWDLGRIPAFPCRAPASRLPNVAPSLRLVETQLRREQNWQSPRLASVRMHSGLHGMIVAKRKAPPAVAYDHERLCSVAEAEEGLDRNYRGRAGVPSAYLADQLVDRIAASWTNLSVFSTSRKRGDASRQNSCFVAWSSSQHSARPEQIVDSALARHAI